MDEKEIYEALGVTPPEGEPPAEGEPEAGSEAAAETGPAEEPEEGEAEGQEEQPGGGEKPEDGEAAPDENERSDGAESQPRENLEAKWRAMTEQAVSRALEEERARNKAQWDAFFSQAGLKDNLDGGKPIHSLEEFQAWKARYDRAKLEKDLSEGKLSPEAFEAAVRAEVEKVAGTAPVGRDDPARRSVNVQEAAGGAPGSSHPVGRPEGRLRAGATPGPQVSEEQINAELAEIHRLDGGVNGLEDILRLETGGAFREAVRRGHSFLDAFKLANFDRLQQRRQAEAAQRAAQAARNNAASKEHLKASAGKSGGSATPVPGDVMEVYRLLMPGASEAAIMEHYNKSLKELKGEKR